MQRLFINIAEFNIQVEFEPSKDLKISKLFYKGFKHAMAEFLGKKRSSADFIIIFCDKDEKPEGKKRERNKIFTFYQDYTPYNIIVQNVLYFLLSKNNGLIIHSSSSAKNGQAYLFLGNSGAGKSTIVQLLSLDLTPLTDDTTILRRRGKKFFLYQHPFIEKNHVKKSGKKYELKNVYFLRKSKKNEAEKIKDKDYVLRNLLKQLTVADKNMLKNLMSFTSSFNNFFLLYFTLERDKIVKNLI